MNYVDRQVSLITVMSFGVLNSCPDFFILGSIIEGQHVVCFTLKVTTVLVLKGWCQSFLLLSMLVSKGGVFIAISCAGNGVYCVWSPGSLMGTFQ